MIVSKISSKKTIHTFVQKKVGAFINVKHIYGVMNILFDEMRKDLLEGKSIIVKNFGTLKISRTQPHEFYNVIQKKMMMSSPGIIVRFVLPKILRTKLTSLLKKPDPK